MANILGVSAGYHDAAAVLFRDGKLVAAMQEERFSRIKHDPSLPRQAAHCCLAQAQLTPADLDQIRYYENPFAKLERVLLSLVRRFPRSWKQFPRAVGSQVGSKLWILDQIAAMLDVPRSRVLMSSHHRSHAASSFFCSPFDRAAILTVDGVGEDITTAIWQGHGSQICFLEGIEYPHSLGLFYAALTAYLGFEVNEGEYKVMGLAAYGEPRYKNEFCSLINLHADGSFELNLAYFSFHTDTDIGFNTKLENLLGPRRSPGKPWNLEASEEDRRFANIAATLQWTLEKAVLGLARRAKDQTGCEKLCLAGGVALNCVANARLLREGYFSRIFVQPAAGDAGGALGAAILGVIELEGIRPAPLVSCALGEQIANDEVLELVRQLGIKHRKPDDVFSVTADLISAGKLVAFAKGRFEWGPRALGQRSILGLASDLATRERLNRVVKRREPFRPFAPATLKDRADCWFTEYDDDMAPFMTSVARVRSNVSHHVAACTHIDGTARLQTVTSESSPELFHLLEALDRSTDLPVLVNTSLNGNGEPIVASAVDAVSFFCSHSVDAMVAGDLVLERT